MVTRTVTITAAQAVGIINQPERPHLPFLVLNERGQAAVTTWVERVGMNGIDPIPFFPEAEEAANNAMPDEVIVVEMRWMLTRSGRPETITLCATMFDWQIEQEVAA